MARRRPLAPVAVAIAVLLGACGWAEDDSTTTTLPGEDPASHVEVTEAELGPFAVATDDLGGPGTPLGAPGLSVPEGTALLGVPFPDLTGGGGFRALLLVTGSPSGAFDALASQAGGLGMARDGGCLGTEQALVCAGRFVDPADGESLEVEVLQEVAQLGVASGLALRYRPPGSDDVGAPGDQTASATAPLPTVALPEPVPVPPDDDVGLALRDLAAPVRHVEEGSELVGLPGPCACGAAGWSFVVRVDGRVRDVIAGYARQFSDLGDPPDVSDRYSDGQTVLGLRVGEGATAAELRAVAPDDGTAYLLVTVIGT